VATVYSQRFLYANFPTSPTNYVVPAGYRAVLRDVTAYWNGDVSQGVLNIAIGGLALIYRFTGPASTPGGFQLSCRVVLEAGDTLEIDAAAGNWGYVASGYLLTLP